MTNSLECLCGRARAGCDYHDPALQPDQSVAVVIKRSTIEETLARSSEILTKLVNKYGSFTFDLNIPFTVDRKDGRWIFVKTLPVLARINKWFVVSVPEGFNKETIGMEIPL